METDYFTDDFLAIKQQMESEVIHAEKAPDKAEDENKIPCYKKYFATPKDKFFTPEFLKFMDEVHESCDLENLLEELQQRDVCECRRMRCMIIMEYELSFLFYRTPSINAGLRETNRP